MSRLKKATRGVQAANVGTVPCSRSTVPCLNQPLAERNQYRLFPHLWLLYHATSPRNQHLLCARLQQSHRRRVVWLHVEVTWAQSAPFASALNPLPIIERLVTRVLKPAPASPAEAPPTIPVAPTAIAVATSSMTTSPWRAATATSTPAWGSGSTSIGRVSHLVLGASSCKNETYYTT